MRYTNKRTFFAISFWNSARKNEDKKESSWKRECIVCVQVKPRKAERRDKVKTVLRPFSRFEDPRIRVAARIVNTTRYDFVLQYCPVQYCHVLICRGVTSTMSRFAKFLLSGAFRGDHSSSRGPLNNSPAVITPHASRDSEQQLANFSYVHPGGWWTHPLYIKSRVWGWHGSAKDSGWTWAPFNRFIIYIELKTV